MSVMLPQITLQATDSTSTDRRRSAVCRLLPPTMRSSVSPLEKTGAQIQLARVGNVPTRSMEVRGNLRPRPCENYFQKFNVVIRDSFIAVFAR